MMLFLPVWLQAFQLILLSIQTILRSDIHLFSNENLYRSMEQVLFHSKDFVLNGLFVMTLRQMTKGSHIVRLLIK